MGILVTHTEPIVGGMNQSERSALVHTLEIRSSVRSFFFFFFLFLPSFVHGDVSIFVREVSGRRLQNGDKRFVWCMFCRQSIL